MNEKKVKSKGLRLTLNLLCGALFFMFTSSNNVCKAYSMSRTKRNLKMHRNDNWSINDNLGQSKQPSPMFQTFTNDRRSFLSENIYKATKIGSVASGMLTIKPLSSVAAIDIKVTPMAHTFITSSSGSSSPKPLRENDATRYLTNAKVVYLFSGSSDKLPENVLKLTYERKLEAKAGVTPGTIYLASMNQAMIDSAISLNLPSYSSKDGLDLSYSSDSIASLARSLPNDGDTLLVGPIPSTGVSGDGKMVADCAKNLGLSTGGAKSGGVLSVLLDGPVQNLEMESGNYPISTILWYSIS